MEPETWTSPQHILVILAHPDDPEFFCGATLARWARAGHPITYLLLTCADKGFNHTTHPGMTPEKLCAIRHEEQRAAADVIGAQDIHIMDFPDGHLVADMTTRRDVVREIRRHKPEILVTCDPQNLFPDGRYLAYIGREDGRFRVMLHELASGQARALTDSARDESPSFAPNGQSVLYATVQGGHGILGTVSLDGKTHARLSESGVDAREPDWGP